MKFAHVICGFSKDTDELIFERDIAEPISVLRQLFDLEQDDPMVDVCPIITEEQKIFFMERYGIVFDSENDYQLHAYQA